ncbi:MAG: urease accessory protein UreE [Cyanobacteriota bacterium]|nr:urease accessory protein UreE [Cyanobacteriota bacterium]
MPPLLLSRRLGQVPLKGQEPLHLALTAEERTRQRGLRHSTEGEPLLLQLPRGEPLEPGELLAPEQGPQRVRVEAAPEPLLRVRAADGPALLQAAYHLGNRHVALEIHGQELRLLDDPVLAHLLEHRGLVIDAIEAPFRPESGAYGGHGHGH